MSDQKQNPLDEYESQTGMAFRRPTTSEQADQIVAYARDLEKRLVAQDTKIFDIFAEFISSGFEYVDSMQALGLIEKVLQEALGALGTLMSPKEEGE